MNRTQRKSKPAEEVKIGDRIIVRGTDWPVNRIEDTDAYPHLATNRKQPAKAFYCGKALVAIVCVGHHIDIA